MALICQAVGAEPAADTPLRSRQPGLVSIEEIAAEHQDRWTKLFDRGPRGTDIVRGDRDAR